MSTLRSSIAASAIDGKSRIALSIIVLHVGLVTALGANYAKIGSAPIYVTEVVLILAVMFGARAALRQPWDSTSRLVVVLCMLAGAWLLVTGPGDTAAGLKGFSFFVYSGFYFIVRGVAGNEGNGLRVFRAVAFGTGVAVILGVANMTTGGALSFLDSFSIGFIETSTGSTRWIPGEFGLYGVFAIILACTRPLVMRRATRADGVLAFLGLTEMILAQHRSSVLALGTALLVMALLLPDFNRVSARLLRLGMGAAVALGALIFFFGDTYMEESLGRWQRMFDTDDSSAVFRLVAWFEVSDGVWDRPLGHGFAEFDFFFNRIDPLIGSHNSYLDLTYRIGFPGLVLLFATVVVHLRSARRAVAPMDLESRVPVVASAGCLVAVMCYAALNMSFETPFEGIFFWIFMGVGAAAVSGARKARAGDPCPQ